MVSGTSPSASSSSPADTLLGAMDQIEQNPALDRLVDAVQPVMRWFVADPGRRDLLTGAKLGHSAHPVVVDVPVGLWTSAALLDVVGGRAGAAAAQRLTFAGLLAFGPAAWTGWAELATRERAQQRVGVVHAVTMGSTAVVQAASWRARRRGQGLRGRALGLLGLATLTVGGYLGGHLAGHVTVPQQP